MNYRDGNFNQFLIKDFGQQPPQYTDLDADYLFSEIDGAKIVNYSSDKYRFIPTNQPADPKEGEMYYDETTKKVKIFNGTAFEVVSSS